LTAGLDGNLWFPGMNRGSIEQIVLSALPPPRVTRVVAVTHSRGGMTSITLRFDEALDRGTARNRGFSSVASAVRRQNTLVFTRRVRIGRVSYDGRTSQVTLTLARPHQGRVQVTVHGGIMAANGSSSDSEFTAIVR
jgi:hypothetical protein